MALLVVSALVTRFVVTLDALEFGIAVHFATKIFQQFRPYVFYYQFCGRSLCMVCKP